MYLLRSLIRFRLKSPFQYVYLEKEDKMKIKQTWPYGLTAFTGQSQIHLSELHCSLHTHMTHKSWKKIQLVNFNVEWRIMDIQLIFRCKVSSRDKKRWRWDVPLGRFIVKYIFMLFRQAGICSPKLDLRIAHEASNESIKRENNLFSHSSQPYVIIHICLCAPVAFFLNRWMYTSVGYYCRVYISIPCTSIWFVH